MGTVDYAPTWIFVKDFPSFVRFSEQDQASLRLANKNMGGQSKGEKHGAASPEELFRRGQAYLKKVSEGGKLPRVR